MKLMSVAAARQAMLAEIQPAGLETVGLAQAIGRVLGEDVTALRDQPPFTNSAMDGWALRASDTPARLEIIGESAAGHGFPGQVEAGQAVRIFTGAALPTGADTVVIQEDAERDGQTVRIPLTPPGENIRKAGRDFHAGDSLLQAGLRIDPWRLSLCASAGRAEVKVRKRPSVAVLSTGEEIVEAPAQPGPFQIYDSGSPALVAMIESWGGVATKRSGIGDRLEAVVSAMSEAQGDIVVTVGGASVGDHDLVRTAAAQLGLTLKVESVAVRPGKPTFFGVLGDGRLLLGLPGNPASAFVCAELFLRPMMSAWCGAAGEPGMVRTRLDGALSANGPREHWMRARLVPGENGLMAQPFGDQDSSLVTVFAGADALLRRMPHAPAAGRGDLVDILVLNRG